ncbi:hypothetical protein NMY22_g12406 [Coprinellus aureogranulatus]|nr:hypothetical protein NMY22_g12406 [Coprinellus aureogranulatus]
MPSVPPGIVYLIQNLPSLVVPPATVLILGKVASNHIEAISGVLGRAGALNEIPAWLIITLAALSLPATVGARIVYQQWKDERDAAAHNAILPPKVKGGPAGLTLLKRLLNNFTHGYPGELFSECFEEAGSYMVNMRILFENRFLTAEPDHIKAILATQFESFEKGPLFHEQLATLLGVGVFNSDGEMWKFHRAMTRPFFSKERISHFDIFDRHAMDALNQLSARLKEGHPVDIQDLAARFTMDSATEFLFAKDVRSLGAGLPYPHYSPLAQSSQNSDHPSNRFARAFDEAQGLMSTRTRKGMNWRLYEFWRDEVEVRMRVINGFLDPIIEAAIQRNAGRIGEKEGMVDSHADDDVSLLDHLARHTSDQKVLRDETLNILLAGRDTTANSITWAVYMLSQHPEVLRKLREEILEKVGETRRPTFTDMKDMKYLRAVINETLRLYPAVVGYSVLLMHKRTDLWGPDAEKFDPDRFLDDRVKTYITPNPFIFLPFNAGPRICLGQQFAYHETSFFLIRLLQRFTNIQHILEAQLPASRPPLEWKGQSGPKGVDDVRIKSQLTMSVNGGVWVKMDEVAPSQAS